MRGLLNQNIAAFDSDNCFGFPPVPQYTGQVKSDRQEKSRGLCRLLLMMINYFVYTLLLSL